MPIASKFTLQKKQKRVDWKALDEDVENKKKKKIIVTARSYTQNEANNYNQTFAKLNVRKNYSYLFVQVETQVTKDGVLFGDKESLKSVEKSEAKVLKEIYLERYLKA